jgi:hypothetical protein
MLAALPSQDSVHGGAMTRFRERHGASATTWPFPVRLAITAVMLVWPAMALIEIVVAGGTARAWFTFLLIVGTASATLVLRSVWVLSDDAVRDDRLATNLSTRLSRSLDEDAGAGPRPLIAERRPPRRW